MEPEESVQRFLDHKEGEYSAESHREVGDSLERFLERCDHAGVENTNDGTGRSVSDFADWRGGNVEPATVKTDLDRVRVFPRYCEGIDAVEDETADRIVSPQLADEDEVRQVRVDQDGLWTPPAAELTTSGSVG